jgi:hypothetical protein
VASNVAQGQARLIGRSAAKANPKYPHNSITETPSGHIMEFDDTPGYERIRIRHRTGSEIELHANGDYEMLSAGSAYTIISRDAELVVRGSANIVIESSCDIRVQGDANLQVEGDLNQLVEGNYNLEVAGDHNTRVHGNSERITTGGLLESTRGNVIRRNLSNSLERTVGDHTVEVGGTFRSTAEGEYHISAYGELQASFHGGLMTMNGKDADGEPGQGQFIAETYYGNAWHGSFIFVDTELHATEVYSSELHVDGPIYADSVDAPTLDGTATKATWATTAGSAPTGPSTPSTPSPDSPGTPDSPEAAPSSAETVTDVTGTSDDFIVDSDRSSLNGGYSTRALSTDEASHRMRNPKLFNDPAWLRDQVETGAVLESVTSMSVPAIKRFNRNPPAAKGRDARIRSIPLQFQLTSLTRATPLSPHYRLSHVLINSPLHAQLGLGAIDIAKNAQLLAFNVLEPLRSAFGEEWSVAEGIYSLYTDEQIGANSMALAMAQGLGVGIRIPRLPNSAYFDMAQWLHQNIVFDQLVLSYGDYDPSGLNEPTLLVALKATGCAKTVRTEFNHQTVESALLDLSDDT